MKPMLAASFSKEDQLLLAEDNNDPLLYLPYPLLCTPKLDGIRCITHQFAGEPVIGLTRSLKPVPNIHVQRCLAESIPGLDGELMVGGNFQDVSSGIMSQEGAPSFQYCVFDMPLYPFAYLARTRMLKSATLPSFCVRLIPQYVCSAEQLIAFESACLELKYEGVIMRKDVAYKHGRSTWKEFGMVKLKRFCTDEAVIIGYEELMHNANAPEVNALGYQERSTHAANMMPMNTLGALFVHSDKFGDFNIGSGFDAATRQYIWENRSRLLGQLVTFKYQPHGVKVKPRLPIFLGFRGDL